MNNNKRLLYWGLTLGWTLAIYSTLSIMRTISSYLEERLPFETVLTIIVCLILGATVIFFLQHAGRLSVFRYVLLFAVTVGYVYGIFTVKYPIEKIHFVQYGVLAYFAFRAFACDLKGVLPYIGAFILTALIGYGDELIQGVLPDRYYDDNDVILNAVSAAMALGLVYIFKQNDAENAL